MSNSEHPFGSRMAERLLELACDRVGLRSEGAQLIRLGENAIFSLAEASVVVRIARSFQYRDSAAREVLFSRWLAHSGTSAARALDFVQPLMVEGHPVTFWELIDGRRGSVDDIADLGVLLRDLHSLPRPDEFELPDAEVLDRVAPRIQDSDIPSADREFLQSALEELRHEVESLRFKLAPAVVHGDAHVQNLMVVDKRPILIDFERVAFGQPEWDLAVTATEYVTAGWWTDEQYASFVESYGYDVMSWSGFDTLRRVNEIKMTTWLMQNIGESPEVEREYHVRMQTIRGERNDRAWSTF